MNGQAPGFITERNFPLTTAIDSLTGTSSDDTLIGDNTGASATVTAGDQIDGVAGNVTSNYYGAAAAVVLPQMKNVATLNQYAPTATTGLNMSALAGLQNVNDVNSVFGANNLTGLFLVASRELGFNNVAQDAAQTVTASFGTSATAATQNVSNGSNTGTVNLDGAAVKTLNVESAGSKANTVDGLGSTWQRVLLTCFAFGKRRQMANGCSRIRKQGNLTTHATTRGIPFVAGLACPISGCMICGTHLPQ